MSAVLVPPGTLVPGAVVELPEDEVRVIVPDTGGGFGGKHTGEAAVEAAKLARAAGRPVSVRWTREEEFTWAYFRPAALIEARAGLDASGSICGCSLPGTGSSAEHISICSFPIPPSIR